MPTGNPNGMTARKALKVLRGEAIRTLAQAKADALTHARIARAGGFSGKDVASEVSSAAQTVVDALRYAEAAVFTFKDSGKSALKAAARIGYTPGA